MASITFWNRIEPSPRSDKLERHVAAQVRDPLWFLTRQWQFGEFQGEDAASPAYVEIAGRLSPVTGWYTDPARAHTFDNTAPLEELVQTEGLTPDWATAVELGQYVEQLFMDAGLSADVIAAFRSDYPIPAADAVPEAARDRELRRFLIACHGRSIDGLALLTAVRDAAPALPARPVLPPGVDPDAVAGVLQAFDAWAAATFGAIGRVDADAWRADRLEYRARIAALSPQGDRITLEALPTRDGAFDWYAFDQVIEQHGDPDEPREPRPEVEPQAFSLSVLPTRVTFPGMPDLRWWHFEDNQRNLGEIRAGRLELGKIIVLDFMLVHGDDWYVIPFAQEVSTLCGIDAFLVHDVFGEATLVPRADADPSTPWTMFSVETQSGGHAGYFFLPPSARGVSLRGEAVEEVRLVRDEMANMAWGIEKVTETGVGTRWPGHERGRLGSEPIEYVPAAPDAPPVKYLLQTGVPEHWIPLVPRQIDAARRSVALQRGAVLRPPENGRPAQPVLPLGRILNPTDPAYVPDYFIAEEEVPREGSDVTRRMERCRWIDGSTHLWVARERRPGAGEGSSGLRFDLAIQARKRQ